MGLSIDESCFNTLFDGISNFYKSFLDQQKQAVNEMAVSIEDSEERMISEALCSPCRGILIGVYAKLLKNLDISIGQNNLFKWLRNNKYLDGRNIPYQKYVDMGLFVIKETNVTTSTGSFPKYTTKVTAKGQCYFAKKLLNERHGMDE